MRSLLLRHIGFFGGAAAVLAASVGLNLIVFSYVNALWFRPLPFQHPDRLVTVLGSTFHRFDAPLFSTFSDVAGQVPTDIAGLIPEIKLLEVARDVEVLGVTAGYFRLLGLSIRGRDFVADDNREGAEPVAIISERLWSREFGRRPDIVGAVIAAQPMSVRVIGVAPVGFEGAWRGERTDVWLPSALVRRVTSVKSDSWSLPMIVLARLAPDDTVPNADRRLKQQYATSAIVPLRHVYGAPGSERRLIREENAASVVGGLALLVLLGGCAAIAALVLVHFERRRLELAVRTAIGASRGRLVALLARELATLALLGSVGAIAVAHLGLGVIPSLSLPGGVNLGRLDVSLDWRVLTVGVGLAVFTIVLAASMPLARFSRVELANELQIGPANTTSAASQRARQGLLALLVGATVIVLVAAGLFIRAVNRGFDYAPGFEVAPTVFATVHLAPPLLRPGNLSISDIARRTTLVRDALRAVPGVDTVADGMAPIDPLADRLLQSPVTMKTSSGDRQVRVGRLAGSPELISALGVPVLMGRGLIAADTATKNPAPALITESLAGRLWPAQSPLGQIVSGSSWRGGPVMVVGVVRDFTYGSLSAPAEGVVIVATDALTFGVAPRFIVRMTRADATSINELRHAIRNALPDVPPAQLLTGADVVQHDLGRQRLGAWFFSGFGLVALMVGLGSVFGLVAYLAESRRREFGVRLALGATQRDVLRLGVMTALIPVAFGAGVGIVAAAIISQVFTSYLVGISGLDALTYIAVVTAMLSAAVLAAVTAAWRLRYINPAEALRMN